MASWDSRRLTLAERSGQRATSSREQQETAAMSDRSRVVALRHCWVVLPDLPDRVAGLVVEWRRDQVEVGWLGRVVYAVDDAGSAVLVEAWVRARHLLPAT